MKKGNILAGTLALCMATMAAFAFKTGHSAPVDLYYFNSDKNCVAAPCETINNTNKACLVTVYSDSNCRSVYKGTIWTVDGDQ